MWYLVYQVPNEILVGLINLSESIWFFSVNALCLMDLKNLMPF